MCLREYGFYLFTVYYVCSRSNLKFFTSAKKCRRKSKIIELASVIVRNKPALKIVEVNLGYDGKMAEHVGMRKVGQLFS